MRDSFADGVSQLQAMFFKLPETPIETLVSELHLLSISCKDNAWLTCSGSDLTAIFVDTFGLLKAGYVYCLNAAQSDSAPYNDKLKSLVNGLYELQCLFTTSMPQCEKLKDSLHTPFAAANLAVAMASTAGAADKLDARLSLPIWKSLSSLMQQFKNEIRHHSHNDRQSLVNRPAKSKLSHTVFLDDILKILLDSIRYFFNSCELLTKQSNIRSDGSSAWNTKLKMLNLLARIGTFCIHEFVSIKRADQTKSEICTWLNWMIATKHAGGLFPSGTGLVPKLVESLNSSLFLSLDVLLSQLVSFQPPSSPWESGKNREAPDYPCLAQWLIYADMKPAVKCRMFGGMLASLTHQQQCYHRWVNKNINLYDAFLKAFAQISELDECCLQESTFQGISAESLAITGEFYVTCLKQLCASVCGLPKACFSFLEEALISALFCPSELAALLSADIWCLLARYGTGDLCWQYVMMFTGAMRRILSQSVDSVSKQFHPLPNHRARNVKRIGRLLSRLVVFLTPKQQLQLLQQYPLDDMSFNKVDGGDESLSVWHMIPLSIERLQKSSRTLAASQVSNRLKQLTGVEDDATDLFFLEKSLTVQLVDGLSMDFRRQHASELAKLVTTFFGPPPDKLSQLSYLFPTVHFNYLIGSLARWLPEYSSLSSAVSTGSTSSNSPSRLLSVLVSSTGPFDHPSILLAMQGWNTWLRSVNLSSIKHPHRLGAVKQQLSWLRKLRTVILPKVSAEFTLPWTCQLVLQKFNLNLETLCLKFQLDDEEIPIPPDIDLTEQLTALETMVDHLTTTCGGDCRLISADHILQIHRIIDRLKCFTAVFTT